MQVRPVTHLLVELEDGWGSACGRAGQRSGNPRDCNCKHCEGTEAYRERCARPKRTLEPTQGVLLMKILKAATAVLVVAGTVLFATQASAAEPEGFPDNLRWEFNAGGDVPPNAIPAGVEHHGEVLYICRAELEGGVHPGKTSRGIGACAVPWGGYEHNIDPYEVLVLVGGEAARAPVSAAVAAPIAEEAYLTREQIVRVLRDALTAEHADGRPDHWARLRAVELALTY